MAKKAQMPKGGIRRKVQAAPKRSVGSTWVLWAVIAAVVLAVIGVIILQAQSVRRPIETTKRIGEGAAWGPADAPVKIIEYSNFGCGHCRDFALDQGKQLRAEYEGTGKVRLQFKYFQLSDPAADEAANAAECAADQGRFWDYHDVLFGQQGVSRDPFTKAALKNYGAQLGLDMARFGSCVDKSEHLPKVRQDSQEGVAQGVEATPTFFINGQKIIGAVPYADLKAAVDARLAAVK
jgi:protein-disulfide isomerase